MGTFEWQRSLNYTLPLQADNTVLGSINPGQTLHRIHFGWSVFGYAPSYEDPIPIANLGIYLGIITVDNGGLPPSPYAGGADIARPVQRWLFMENRGLYVTASAAEGNVLYWADSPRSAPDDTKGQVKVPSDYGNYVNIWASWDCNETPPVSGFWTLQIWANCLIETD